MTIPAFWSQGWTAALANHLWQSTVVVVIAWLLALALRKNHARMRYWVWMAASVKFLLPFSLLIVAGGWLRSLIAAPIAEKPVLTNVMTRITEPFPQTQFLEVTERPIATYPIHLLPSLLFAIWICGALIVILRWARAWSRIHAAVRAASPLALTADVPVLSASVSLEPGIFGIFRPVLLLPEGILKRLTPEQLRAIVAHEMCHVRRRDNLTFALHMAVEVLCWFHPAVWWIGKRLVEERERACDEAVLEADGEAAIYAEGILNVCKFYVEAPLKCSAGVTGSDLKERIVRIMARHTALKMGPGRKLLLGTAAMMLVAGPVAEGLAGAFNLHAQLLLATGNRPSFEVATIKPSRNNSGSVNFGVSPTRFDAESATLKNLIQLAYNINSDDQLGKGPDWMSSKKFDVDAKIGDAGVDAMKKLPPDHRLDQYRLMVQSLLVDRFKLKVSTAAKEQPVLALVAAKDGPKLTQASATSGTKGEHMPMLYGGSRGDISASAVTMKFLADFFLSGREDLGGRVVIDATGLQGSYDFTLKWSPVDASAPPPDGANAGGGSMSAPPDSSGPSLITALQEQLGLKLVPRKAPVQVLVIDHVEQPSAN